ncbi:PspC domain-containing protein [Knoellia sp. S7-12]|uniref:PspC domain-containing protein n=1 Tax=Knoellia sp. S7-12 TaxID=3126698 RepID=UPI003369901A
MTQTPQPAETAQSQGSKFWDDILSIGIPRDRSRQWFGGVCSGVARKVDVDPVLIRAAVIALTLFGGFGIVVYLVAWLLMPDETGRIMARDALNRDGNGDAGGAIALSVIALVVIAAIVFGDNGFFIGWGIVPLAVIGWFVWRHLQRKEGVAASPWSASQPAPVESTGQAGQNVYAASAAPASYAPTAPYAPNAPATTAAPTGASDGSDGWQPPPAPPVPPRAHMPLAPPPPPRPRRRSAGFAGFALVLGVAIVGYGAGLMLDDTLNFSGTRELFGGVIALGAASLATMVIGLMGRRSLMSVALVMILGLGTAVAGVGEQTWNGGQGTRTWTPSLSAMTTRYEHGAGETTIDLRPLADQLANPSQAPVPEPTPAPSVAPAPSAPAPGTTASPVPTRTPTPTPTPTTAPTAAVAPVPTVPQRIEIRQGAGEMRIIVPEGANAQIHATTTFGEVQVRGDLPGGVSDRDRGDEDGPSETLTLNVGSGTPTIIIRAEMTFGQITIQEG